ncbi:MAG: ligase-associated DNA damage response exonuclease [Sphingopyxis sp.]|nr:ligase-associated DNA damage response exonuclease [Sphingopyxis sp.]
MTLLTAPANASKRARWIDARREGIYIPAIDSWVDPARPVERALITHGHADHARGGHGHVFATPATLAIMDVRYGDGHGRTAVDYGESIDLGAGITASWHPAGHVLGSAQIRLERDGEVVVITGDYKRRSDPTCAAFEVVPCDVFITEATFGLPVFRHPPTREEAEKLIAAAHANPDRAILVGAYALGKAQRLIAELRGVGYTRPIYIHGALARLVALYQQHGVDLGEVLPVAGMAKEALAGQIVLAPPSALADRWSRRLPDPITAMASGWMRVRARARQRGVELPLVISDHADWDELTQTIVDVAPREVWVTHGRDDALVHWCMSRQITARALHLAHDDEDEDD